MVEFLLDSVILIDHFNGISPATAYLLEITKPVADLAASLRRDHGWKLLDAFQAALAQHHGLKLATRNTKDFPPARHEFVLVPYELEAEG